MKTVLTDNIVKNARRQQFPKSSLNHIQESYKEGLQALLLALNVNPAEVTILTGAVVVLVGSDFTVAAGWAAYDNEIFQVDAGAFTAAGGETGVWVIDETFLGTDPVKFDDGNEFNVNQIRKLKLQSLAAGTGVADYGEAVALTEKLLTHLGVADLIQAAIDALVGGAPGALDTLNELAAALSDDENFSTTVTNLIATEATNRANADTTLQANINNEATTRGNADTALQANIDAEAAARAAADATKVDKVALAWTAVAYNADFSDHPGAVLAAYEGAVEYAKTPGGIVWIRGAFQAVAAADVVAFTLPAGFRPGRRLLVPQSSYASDPVSINTNGDVEIYKESASPHSGSCAFHYFSFIAEG